MIIESDRRALLDIARAAIAAHVMGHAIPAVVCADALRRLAGAFVSLHANGELRGCIGHIEPDEPIGEIIASCARSACSLDPRFPAVTVSELDNLAVELSILGPLEDVLSADQIEIGRHGLAVERGRHRGLLLPQVATEWGWSRQVFIEHTCKKAGLPGDAWQHGAKLWRFEAEVFGER